MSVETRTRRARRAPAHAALLAVLSGTAGATAATLEVHTATDGGAVNRDLYGANIEYVGADTPATAAVIAGTPIARFPGGDDVSQFVWDRPTRGACALPRWNWDAIATLARRTGMRLMLETNVVRGSPAGAAAWVRDALARGIAVPYVDVGNEVWGHWDAGFRSPAQYEADVRATAAAVRAVSPTTRIVLNIGTFNQDGWNREAVRRTADVIDAVDYHYYPNHDSPADPTSVVAGADGIAPLMVRLRAMLRDAAGPRAPAIGIIVGEWDGAADPPHGVIPPGRSYAAWNMADALFYGAAVGEFQRGGVLAAMFYELQGVRFGALQGDACRGFDPAVRRPKELVLRLYREHFGERMVDAVLAGGPTITSTGPTRTDGFAGTAPAVRVYASLADAGRSLRLMVVNRAATDDVPLEVALHDFEPDGTLAAWQVRGAAMTATNENVGGPPDAVHTVASTGRVAGARFTWTAPSHSVTALQLTRRAPAPNPGAHTVVTPGDAAVDAARPHAPAAHRTTPASAGCAVPSHGPGSAGLAAVLGLFVIGVRRRRRTHPQG